MKLTDKDLITLAAIAEEALLKSGKMIEDYISIDPKKNKLEIKRKNAGSSIASQIVTEVDLKSQQIILEVLSSTLKQYDVGVLSEEFDDDRSRLEKDYFWCIDPLDGTLAFTKSELGFSVSIALVSKEGSSQIGLVYEPTTQTIYSAVKGKGGFKNGKSFKSKYDEQQPIKNAAKKLTVIVENNLAKSVVFEKIINQLNKITHNYDWQGVKIIEGTGAVMNACQVIENSPAVYFKLPKVEQGGGSLWDFAATSCLFNELAGSVSDVFGNQLDLNNQKSTFMNHCGVIYASEQEISYEVRKIFQRVLT